MTDTGNRKTKYAPPAGYIPMWSSGPTYVPQGCICPPTSEQTCQNPMCPRKGPQK